MEKITANMESAKLLKFKLDLAIHSVMFHWSQLEEIMDSTNRFYEERLKESELKEKELISIQESVIEQNKMLEFTEDFVGALTEKTRQVNERFKELARKGKQLGSYSKSTGKRVMHVESKGKEVAAEKETVEATIAENEADGSQFGNEPEQITFVVARFRRWIEKRHIEMDAEEKERAEQARKFEEIALMQNNLKRDSPAVDLFHSSTMKRLKAEEKELTDRAVKLEPMGNQIDVKVEVKAEAVKNEMDINDEIKAVEIKTERA